MDENTKFQKQNFVYENLTVNLISLNAIQQHNDYCCNNVNVVS